MTEEIANKEDELSLLYEKLQSTQTERAETSEMTYWEVPVINKFELVRRKWSCELIVTAINPSNEVS